MKEPNKHTVILTNALELSIDSTSFLIKLNLHKQRIRVVNSTTGDEATFSSKQAYSSDIDIIRLENTSTHSDKVWTIQKWNLSFLVSSKPRGTNFRIYLGDINASDSNLIVGFCLPNPSW
jgi:hypothetical protein